VVAGNVFNIIVPSTKADKFVTL